MTFEDMIDYDIDNVFFKEFSEIHSYNGQTIRAVVDDESMMQKYAEEFSLLSNGSHMIIVPEEDFLSVPNPSDAVRFDGITYIVNERKIENGVVVLFLERGRL